MQPFHSILMQNSNFQFTHPKTASSGCWAGCLITWPKKQIQFHLFATNQNHSPQPLCSKSLKCKKTWGHLWSLSCPGFLGVSWHPKVIFSAPKQLSTAVTSLKVCPMLLSQPCLDPRDFSCIFSPFSTCGSLFGLQPGQLSSHHRLRDFLRTKPCCPISLECINSIIWCIKTCACRISLISTDIRSHI